MYVDCVNFCAEYRDVIWEIFFKNIFPLSTFIRSETVCRKNLILLKVYL